MDGRPSCKAIRHLLPIALLLLAGCGGEDGEGGAVRLEAWHHAGREAERRTIREQVARFNAQHEGEIRIELTLIPEGSYNAQVQAAALAGELPDLLELDGPYLYQYVWQGSLRPVGPFLPEDTRADILPSIREQGTFRGRLYSVGAFDSALGLYARRDRLKEIGARIPEGPGEAWSVKEFEQVLGLLAEADPDGAVLDLHLNYEGEWFPYAFAPVLWSAGGGLIARPDHDRARGVLDSPESVAAMERLQGWIEAGYVDPNLDDAAFTEGRVALSWGGHWNYPRYRAAVGEDLVVLPLPDFGRGTRTAQGSWNWGIARACPDPEAAGEFLAFLLEDEEVLAMTRANGAVPGTRPALERSPLYGPDGPLRLLAEQLQGGQAVPRPRTPAYPVISTIFQDAFADIRHGMDVREVLERAAAEIDADLEANEGYRFPEEPRRR
ncbi:ABC transporter substrate-binding protein [Thiohalorhabdus denitrificans]|uniref:Multiple sugar transport system substrate-binding protein n=1 Tax=Thiohalorhabdus denitrificans TaxID=381306 RepID=A0A0P9CL37_9GAMM|nr:sugar ABC transporter substrate-binding protein [Thiohalorhabdus denitrificans]KPV39713.1 ABC transporter substrate-binding protein [Thiohalorhabdus denitrificans]SCX92688.1 multiple sugar transport system substrate-binding protein [Thiohalorhabdus denitrificans]